MVVYIKRHGACTGAYTAPAGDGGSVDMKGRAEGIAAKDTLEQGRALQDSAFDVFRSPTYDQTAMVTELADMVCNDLFDDALAACEQAVRCCQTAERLCKRLDVRIEHLIQYPAKGLMDDRERDYSKMEQMAMTRDPRADT